MTYRTFRRRLSEATAAHDWLEGLAFVLGLAFLVLAVVCAWGIVTSIANIGDTEAPPGTPVTVGFLEVTRGFAIVLFALFGFHRVRGRVVPRGRHGEGMVRPRQGAQLGVGLSRRSRTSNARAARSPDG